jgi:astacin
MSDKNRHATLTYEEIDGLAIFEGDIILGRSADLKKTRPRTSVPQCVGDICSSTQPLSVIFGEVYLWPGGVIPFEVDPRFGPQGRAEIGAGISMLTGATNLLVRPRNGEKDYIVFVPSQGCSSWVGRQAGRQDVNVMDGGCGGSGVAHEVLHAAGLWHEQSRSDRDQHVRILWQNIQSGKEHNFEVHASDGVDFGPYDLQSIMHYGGTAFGKRDPATGQTMRTIETIPPGGNVGGANRLSNNDIAGVNQLYPMSRADRYVPIPSLVFGLRHSMNQANDVVTPFVQFGQVVAQRVHGGDLGAPSGQGFNWWMIPTATPLSSVRIEEIPPGVVLGMWHSQNMSSIPGDFRLVTVRGGDLGAPSGVGFVWYETQSTAQVNWNVVDMLPPYTVVGLKHSQNQRSKTFQWRDGRTYDPLVACPDGFDRKDGGDRGAPSGTGFYWCEKRRP